MSRPYLFFSCWLIPVLLLCSACSSAGQSPEIDESEVELYNHLKDQILPLTSNKLPKKLIEAAAGHRLVLMGEASHGTAEFYHRRAMFSKKLIEDKGYNFIAVEGDWTAIFQLNKYVKNLPGAASSAAEVLRGFDRWPEWMWGNTQVEALAEWMREYNEGLPADEKVGIYGIDVYGQWTAMEKLLELSSHMEPKVQNAVESGTNCFNAYSGNEWDYAAAVSRGMATSCESDLANLHHWMQSNAEEAGKWDQYDYFRLHQKTLVLKNAEKHFRTAATDRAGSWNARVAHFWQTTQRLLDFYGDDSKGIVWAHNTHVGDARHTTMRSQGQVNIGQLSREELGPQNVFILGFGTYTGKVNAGSSWGSPMQIMNVPPSPSSSLEYLFSQMPEEEFALLFDDADRAYPPLLTFRGHRAIGVVYNPQQEAGNYVPTMLAHRYDAFWFIRETNELQPIR